MILQSATWWFVTKRYVRSKSAVNIKTDVDSMTTTVATGASKNTLDCSKSYFQHNGSSPRYLKVNAVLHERYLKVNAVLLEIPIRVSEATLTRLDL